MDDYDVYEPAEDSILLLKYAGKYRGKRIMEMGCGSGVVSVECAVNNEVTAVDIMDSAIRVTEKRAEMGGRNIKVIKSDLFSKVEKKYDVIMFNPPYLPCEGDITVCGGEGGIEVVRRFLTDAKEHLAENGEILLILSTKSDIDSITHEFEEDYTWHEVDEVAGFYEKIILYRLTPL